MKIETKLSMGIEHHIKFFWGMLDQVCITVCSNTVLTLHIYKDTLFLLIYEVDGMAPVFPCVFFLGVANDKVFGIITSQEIIIISPFLASVGIALEATAFLVQLNGFTIHVEVPSDFWLWISSGITKQLCLP